MTNAEILKRAAELLLNYPEATFHAWDRPTAEIRYFAAALEAIAAQPTQTPKGWQLAPIDPTPEMVDAGFRAGGTFKDQWLCPASVRLSYRAMLDAAPKEEGK